MLGFEEDDPMTTPLSPAEREHFRQIFEKRLQKGLTQKELAQKIGTKQSAISRLESGKANPSLLFLQKIAKALHSNLEVTFK